MTFRSNRMFASWNRTRKETGYRSKYEADVASSMPVSDFEYETLSLPYSYTVTSHYKPDFILPKQAILIEAKGRFTLEDRTKMLLIKRSYPDLDIRMLFQNAKQKITKTMTAGDWCDKAHIEWAEGSKVPEIWLKHKPTKSQKKAFEGIYRTKGA